MDVLEDRCTPATLIVNSSADGGAAGDLLLTLREALNVVNSQSTAGLSAQELGQIGGTLGSNDTIQFKAEGLNGGQTISLSSSLAPTRNVAITGADAVPVSIVGVSTRAFQLNSSAATKVLLQDLTIQGTSSDGGVGGAIRNNAGSAFTLTVDGCTLSGTNLNEWGGALGNRNGSVTTLINSTIAGSTTNNNGGAIDVQAGTVTLIHCTVSGNTASGTAGGIIVEGGATLNLRNTIIAGNSDSSGAKDLVNSGGTINAQNSLIQNLPAGTINGTNSGNITGQDPALSPLGNNGGPTRTMALTPNSPAINNGSDTLATAAGLTTDQRGQNRFVGAVDIGSYEFSVPTTTTVTSSVPVGLSYGQSATFTATVSASIGSAAPTGSVEFFDDGVGLGAGTLNSTGSGFSTWILATSGLHAGNHSITAVFTQSGASSAFLGSTGGVSQLVNKAALTVTTDEISKTYGQANPEFTVSYSGFATGEDPTFLGGLLTFDTAATQFSDAGDSSVTPGGLTSDDYDIAFVAGTLHINKADQIITWSDPASIVYGTALSGAQLNATVSVVGPSPAGALTFTPDVGTVLHAGLAQGLTVNVAGTQNYNPAQATVHIDVARAVLTVTADDAIRDYAQPDPVLTAQFAGFVNGDNDSVIGGSPAFTTAATTSSPPGDYDITVDTSGLSAADYTFSSVKGTLHVAPLTTSATAVNVAATLGAEFSGLVATFINLDPFSDATSYTATISWGDGVSSAGQITDGGGGVFNVRGSHTFTNAGSSAVMVSVTQTQGTVTPTTANGTATVSSDAVIAGTGLDDDLVVKRTPGQLLGEITYILNGGAPVTLHGATSVAFDGLAGDDTMTVDFSEGRPLATGLVRFDGGADRNAFVVEAAGTGIDGVLITQDGAINVDGQQLTYWNVDRISLDGAVGVNASAGADSTDRARAMAGLTPTEKRIQAMYLAELGRAGCMSELDAWLDVLAAPGDSQTSVARGIHESHEARNHLVQSWYISYLGRQASGGEEQGWVDSLLQGQTEEQVLSGILSSQEFYDRAQTLTLTGSADERFIDALYQVLLNRTAENTSQATWMNVLAQNGRTGVARGILQSAEFRGIQFEGYYNSLLNRPGDRAGLNDWIFSNLDMSTTRILFVSGFEYSSLNS